MAKANQPLPSSFLIALISLVILYNNGKWKVVIAYETDIDRENKHQSNRRTGTITVKDR
ncbi:hypothetical protein [Salicibibacter cibarius]|uniref:hypothetical protein n=1 Tax=Salicibibacter cibarius TaxID=2743000 RepID=UPI0031B59599